LASICDVGADLPHSDLIWLIFNCAELELWWWVTPAQKMATGRLSAKILLEKEIKGFWELALNYHERIEISDAPSGSYSAQARLGPPPAH